MKMTFLGQLALVLCVSTIVFAVMFQWQPKDEPEEAVTTQPLAESLVAAVMAEQETPAEPEEPQSRYNPAIPLPEELQEALFTACEEFGIDIALALGLIQEESDFDVDSVSEKDCYGLCQLNPRYFPSGLTPAENIHYGIEYLAYQLDRYDGDVKAALEGYRAGHDTGKRSYANIVLAYAGEWEERLS